MTDTQQPEQPTAATEAMTFEQYAQSIQNSNELEYVLKDEIKRLQQLVEKRDKRILQLEQTILDLQKYGTKQLTAANEKIEGLEGEKINNLAEIGRQEANAKHWRNEYDKAEKKVKVLDEIMEAYNSNCACTVQGCYEHKQRSLNALVKAKQQLTEIDKE